MHEVGIAASILQTVESEANKRPSSRITVVGLRIGALSDIDRDALQFAFTALTRNTEWESLKFEIEWCPRRQRCFACGVEFVVEDGDASCPACGDARTLCVGGTQLDIAYLELEESCVKS